MECEGVEWSVKERSMVWKEWNGVSIRKECEGVEWSVKEWNGAWRSGMEREGVEWSLKEWNGV